MPTLIVAHFDNQFAACAAVDKLLSRGIRREHLVLDVDESVGNSAASASAPTSVLSNVSHHGASAGHRHVELRSPSHATEPSRFGHAVLTMELDDEMPADDVRHLLSASGAVSLQALDQPLPPENPMMWPAHGSGSPIDVERAICAARGHGSLGPHARH
jgi:hypothetical protein